jgi:PhnB protein
MKPAKPIPQGVNTLTTHFVVRDAPKAIEFYERAFGAEVVDRMFGPDGKTIWHARLRIGNSNLFLADEGTAEGDQSPQSLGGSPASIQMYVEDAEAAFKRALDAGAMVRMPLKEMFWGDLYGQIVDPFGFRWAIAQRLHDLTEEELKHAVRAAAHFGSKGG